MLNNPLGAYRFATKTVTFDGNAGTGAIGNVPLFTVTGQVLVVYIAGTVTTNLAGATATLALGTTNKTTVFIGATTATTMLTTARIWASTTATQGALALPAATKETVVEENIVGTVATAAITAGVLRIDVYYLPLSSNGLVA